MKDTVKVRKDTGKVRRGERCQAGGGKPSLKRVSGILSLGCVQTPLNACVWLGRRSLEDRGRRLELQSGLWWGGP